MSSPEVRIRSLAQADGTMGPIFGAGTWFRWFDRQLPQNAIERGTCLRYRRIGTMPLYSHDGLNPLVAARIQFDILDYDALAAEAAAKAFIAFLETFNLALNPQDASPPANATTFPNFLLGRRPGIEAGGRTKDPVYVEIVDTRIYCTEED